MQKSIKKILSFVMIFSIVITTLSVVAFADASELTPTKELTADVNISTATIDTTTGVVTSKEGGTKVEGLRWTMYPYSKYQGDVKKYTFEDYLTMTMDVEIVNREATYPYYDYEGASEYALIQFMTTTGNTSKLNISIPESNLGQTGDKFKVSIIVAPNRNYYVYYAGKLYTGTFPDTVTDFDFFRYLERNPTTAGKYNQFKFSNGTIKTYDSTCNIEDILYLHKVNLTQDSTNQIRSGDFGTGSGNTFTSKDSNDGVDKGFGIWVQLNNPFVSSFKAGSSCLMAEGKVKVNKRVATDYPQLDGHEVTIALRASTPSEPNNLTKTTQWVNVPVPAPEEGETYDITIVFDENEMLHAWVNGVYASTDLKGKLDSISHFAYTEGEVAVGGTSNEFEIEPFEYTLMPERVKFSDLADNIVMGNSTSAFYGNTLTDGEIDLAKVTDIDGNDSNLEEGTNYILAASKFSISGLLTGLNGMEYGMIISGKEVIGDLTVENCELKAVANKKSGDNFGILFYGNRIVPGTTYYIRPYLYYNNTYIYGTTQTYVVEEN